MIEVNTIDEFAKEFHRQAKECTIEDLKNQLVIKDDYIHRRDKKIVELYQFIDHLQNKIEELKQVL